MMGNRTKKSWFQGIIFGLLLPWLPTQAIAFEPAPQACYLDKNIEAIIQQPEYNQALWGIAIREIGNDSLLYGHNAEQMFIPASSLKLMTTAAALDILGPNHLFQTEIYTMGSAPVLDALIIKGKGDPSLSSEKLVEAIATLKDQQITEIRQVIIDDSHFTEPVRHHTWESSDLVFSYAPPVNSLMLDGNAVTLSLTPTTVGQVANIDQTQAIALNQWEINNQLITSTVGTSYQGRLQQKFGTTQIKVTGNIPADAGPDRWGLAIPNPAKYALDTVVQTLAKQGIRTNQQLITSGKFTLPATIPLLKTIPSVSFPEILATTNQNSDNLYAESLRHTLGQLDPESTGSQAIANTLTDLGVDSNQFKISDGSGLSRHNLTTPLAFVQLLEAMAEHPHAETYKNSLAIAAESGTLRRRFQDSRFAGRFFGKTGTMTNVVSLTGYLDLNGDHTLAISILVNQSPQSARTTRQGIDSIFDALYGWVSCPSWFEEGS